MAQPDVQNRARPTSPLSRTFPEQPSAGPGPAPPKPAQARGPKGPLARCLKGLPPEPSRFLPLAPVLTRAMPFIHARAAGPGVVFPPGNRAQGIFGGRKMRFRCSSGLPPPGKRGKQALATGSLRARIVFHRFPRRQVNGRPGGIPPLPPRNRPKKAIRMRIFKAMKSKKKSRRRPHRKAR